MSDKTKHTSRLPTYGPDTARGIANQIYVQMLTRRRDLIPKITSVQFGTKPPEGIDIGRFIHSKPGGMVYFNEDSGVVFVLLIDDDNSDEAELAAGQIGPMGDM